MSEGELSLGEREELELLRKENELFRRRVEQLENSVATVELNSARLSENPEMDELKDLLAKAHMAKQEALEYTGIGKGKLMEEVKWLNKQLYQAKSEYETLEDKMATLQDEIEVLKKDKAQILAKYHMDREIFARMIKEDRAAYSKKLREREEKIDETEREKQEALDWAQSRHELYLENTKDLQEQLAQAKRDAVAQALEYNDVLAKEINDLEAEVAAYSQVEGGTDSIISQS